MLTVHLKTVKGSVYQAGLIRVGKEDLVENEAGQKEVKVQVVKSLDPEAFCLLEVVKIEQENRGRVKDSKGKEDLGQKNDD